MDGYEYTYGTDPLDSSDYPTPPTADITSPVSTIYNQESVTLTYTVSEGTVTVYTNGVANTTTQPSGNMISGLAEGTYNITIVVVDHTGVMVKESVLFTIDITSPSVNIISPISTTYHQDSVTLTYTVSEGTVTVYMNEIANTTTQASDSLISGLADGTYHIIIIAMDQAGNIGVDTIIFIVDTTTTTPVTTITSTSSPSSSTDTSTSSQPGSFPNIFLLLPMFGICMLYLRKGRKK